MPEDVVVELLVDEGVDLGSDLGKNDQAEMRIFQDERAEVAVVPVWVDSNAGQRDPSVSLVLGAYVVASPSDGGPQRNRNATIRQTAPEIRRHE